MHLNTCTPGMCLPFSLDLCLRMKWIRLFDFYSGKCLAKVAGHSELATGVRFTSDGRRLVTIGGEHTRLGFVRSFDRSSVGSCPFVFLLSQRTALQ